VTTAVIVMLILAGGAAAAVLVLNREKLSPSADATRDPVEVERSVHLRTPDQIGSLVRSTDAKDVARTQSALKTATADKRKYKQTMGATYLDRQNQQAAVVLAATIDIDDPTAEVTFGDTRTMRDPHSIEPGPLGGVAECGTAQSSGTTLFICTWADHGSIGAVAMVNVEPAEGENLFRRIRAAVLIRD
jgi:hypothetical protein